jgi:predicted RNase H-like HicB family nuclease
MDYYLVIYEHTDDGAWGAYSPDAEGIFALGQTREEVETRMAEALSAHLSYLRESGQPIREPHTDAGRIAGVDAAASNPSESRAASRTEQKCG